MDNIPTHAVNIIIISSEYVIYYMYVLSHCAIKSVGSDKSISNGANTKFVVDRPLTVTLVLNV